MASGGQPEAPQRCVTRFRMHCKVDEYVFHVGAGVGPDGPAPEAAMQLWLRVQKAVRERPVAGCARARAHRLRAPPAPTTILPVTIEPSAIEQHAESWLKDGDRSGSAGGWPGGCAVVR